MDTFPSISAAFHRYIGISGYPLSTLRKVVELSTVPIDVVQTYCRNTIMDQELTNYLPFFEVCS